jgi:hypothetical protein
MPTTRGMVDSYSLPCGEGNSASGKLGLLPPPRAPSVLGSRLDLAQVGQARLALGEGWGGGS